MKIIKEFRFDLLKYVSLVAVALVAVVEYAPVAKADTLIGTQTDATGINGLIVDGTSYNVSFIFDNYNNVFATSQPLFLNNQSLATDATNALIISLNGFGVTSVAGIVDAFQGFEIIENPYALNANAPYFFSAAAIINYPTVTNTWSAAEDEPATYSDYGHNAIAVFSVAAIPEPSTWAMMILGFAGSASWLIADANALRVA